MQAQKRESNGKLDVLLDIIKKDLEAKLLQDVQGTGVQTQSKLQALSVDIIVQPDASPDLDSGDRNKSKPQAPGVFA